MNPDAVMARLQPSPLQCPSCSSPLTAQHLDFARAVARCDHCGTLLSLAGATPPSPGWQPRPDFGLPPGLQVDTTPEGLRIRRRWFHPAILIALCFCIAWDSFLLFWYGLAFGTGAPSHWSNNSNERFTSRTGRCQARSNAEPSRRASPEPAPGSSVSRPEGPVPLPGRS